MNFIAKYTKIDSGYMGQIIELPEVITEGKDIEDCRVMLLDALKEVILSYKQLGLDIPSSKPLFEQISFEPLNVS